PAVQLQHQRSHRARRAPTRPRSRHDARGAHPDALTHAAAKESPMSAPIPPYDPTRQMLVTPDDPDAPARVERLHRIGVGNAPLEEFDGIARDLAHALGAPYAMVNFIDTEKQYFAGLFMPANGQSGMELGPEQAATDPRVMARDHGWCPNVVV